MLLVEYLTIFFTQNFLCNSYSWWKAKYMWALEAKFWELFLFCCCNIWFWKELQQFSSGAGCWSVAVQLIEGCALNKCSILSHSSEFSNFFQADNSGISKTEPDGAAVVMLMVLIRLLIYSVWLMQLFTELPVLIFPFFFCLEHVYVKITSFLDFSMPLILSVNIREYTSN